MESPFRVCSRKLYFWYFRARGYPGVRLRRSRITDIVKEYDEVHSFHLERPEGLRFRPGQHTHLVAPGGYINNHDVRHLSFASAPDEETLLFTMDLASGSRFKRRFGRARVGDRVGLYSEKGNFTLDDLPERQPLVLIAGGVGIAPFRSMIRAGIAQPWHLIYAGRGYCYPELWNALGPERVTLADRETLGPAVDARIEEGRLYMVCGSSRFVAAVTARLAGGGVAAERIRVEDYGF